MDNMMMGENKSGMACCKCMHHQVIPILIVLFAVVFLLGYLSVLSMETVNIIWPIIVGVGGLTKLMGGSCKCC